MVQKLGPVGWVLVWSEGNGHTWFRRANQFATTRDIGSSIHEPNTILWLWWYMAGKDFLLVKIIGPSQMAAAPAAPAPSTSTTSTKHQAPSTSIDCRDPSPTACPSLWTPAIWAERLCQNALTYWSTACPSSGKRIIGGENNRLAKKLVEWVFFVALPPAVDS